MNTENAVLALDRIEQKFERLRERLAAVEAERDAQSALADQAVKALAEMNNANGKLMMDLAAVMNERDAALKRAAEARETAENYAGHCNKACKQLEAVEAERDTARAGEARAVEALRTIRGEDIYPEADGMIEDATCLYCYRNSADGCDEDCPRFIAANVIDSAQPALDWLAQQRAEAVEAERRSNTDVIRSLGPAFCDFFFGGTGEAEYLAGLLRQQRREAAAEALEEFADDAGGIEELIRCNISDLRFALRARAAALRAGEVGND